MTASDAFLISGRLHSIMDKEVIEEAEIEQAHIYIEKQSKTIQDVWFCLVGIDNSIKAAKEKYGEDDSLIRILSVARDELAKAIGEPNYFKGE